MERTLREGAFSGETHIVTGAGQGIGFTVAKELAVHGARVALVDLDEGRLSEAKAEIAKDAPVEPIIFAGNVADEDAVKNAVAGALEAGDHINGVVNVAGITRDTRIVKKSYEDFKLVMAVHLHGTFLFMREAAFQCWHPAFKASGGPRLDDGVNRFVVNFSSVSAKTGNIGQIDYTAAKGAIEAATRTAAREFSAYGVRVNAVAPGPVDTPMLAAVPDEIRAGMGKSTLVGRIAQPTELARAVLLLADPALTSYVSGQILPVNGGMNLG